MAKTETLHVRIDPDTKRSTDEILSVLGLSTAEAVNIFLHQIVLRGGLPFQIMLPAPNDETLAAMREAREIASVSYTHLDVYKRQVLTAMLHAELVVA